MAFDNSYTAVTGATYAASDYNTYTKGNFTAVWVGTTAGDMEYYTSATAKARIAAGSIGDVMTIKSAATPGWSSMYPIGSIYISTLSTNPATLLGFGTWTAFAAGRTLVGIDASQTEFDTGGETGGEKTHTLTEAEIPSHRHGMGNYGPIYFGSSAGADRYYPEYSSTFTNYAGGGGAHNNLQPYIVVYMWKRTA